MFTGPTQREVDMPSYPRTPTTVWIGRGLTALVGLALLADAAVDLLAPALLHAQMEATGFAATSAPQIGVLILVCITLYLIPRTSVLGAILITGFFGGAVCTHFRLGEIGTPPQLICLLLGAMAWGGLYLRDGRVRALLPLVSAPR